MPDIGDRLVRLAALLTAAAWPTLVPACNVPVFRYALERWEADAYQIVVFHRGPLTGPQQALLETLEQPARQRTANLVVTRVDLGRELSPPMRLLWNAQQNASPPWLVVKYPKQTGIEPFAWAGPLDPGVIASLIESPARKDIAQKLLRGDAIVWLLLESGDRRRDDEVAQPLESELRNLEQSLVLPELTPLDPPTNPNLPLKISFSTVRVVRSDPAERMLVNLLLNWNTNLITAREVMLFPVFGRGRVIPPAMGEEIRAEAIRDLAEFLTGPCSCEVKAMNPGYDLLLAANWNARSGGEDVVLAAEPPLVGLSEFAAAATTDVSAARNPAVVSLAAASVAPAPADRNHLVRNVVLVLGLSVAFITMATLLLKTRTGRRP